MIEPTQNDIGRKVILRGKGRFVDLPGVLQSFDDLYVRILFAGNVHDAAMSRESVDWVDAR